MRYKYWLAALLLAAVLGVVFLSAPATAASGDDSVSVAGPGGYVVTFYKTSSKAAITSGLITPMAMESSSIVQGQYKWHYRDVNYYTTSLNFGLYWGNPSNSLRLRVFTPDGYVLGPFYDMYDGSLNGATGVTVTRSGGVAQGTWVSEAYGYSVSGTQSYSIGS